MRHMKWSIYVARSTSTESSQGKQWKLSWDRNRWKWRWKIKISLHTSLASENSLFRLIQKRDLSSKWGPLKNPNNKVKAWLAWRVIIPKWNLHRNSSWFKVTIKWIIKALYLSNLNWNQKWQYRQIKKVH